MYFMYCDHGLNQTQRKTISIEKNIAKNISLNVQKRDGLYLRDETKNITESHYTETPLSQYNIRLLESIELR